MGSSVVLALLLLLLAASAQAADVMVTLTARAAIERQRGRDDAVLLGLALPLGEVLRPRAALSGGDDGEAPPRRLPAEVTRVERGAPPPPRVSPLLVRAVVRATLRAAGARATERRLDGLAARSRYSALLPEVRLRGARGLDYSRRLAPTQDDPLRYSEEGAYDLLFEGRLSWRLNRLLFTDEELAVERLRAERATGRQRLVARALGWLWAWERARRQLTRADLNAQQRHAAELRLVEAELWLEWLTAGAFGRLSRPFRP